MHVRHLATRAPHQLVKVYEVCRGSLLAVLATAAGVFSIYSAPDYVASALGTVLPMWFYESQAILVTVGACLSNFLFVAFIR